MNAWSLCQKWSHLVYYLLTAVVWLREYEAAQSCLAVSYNSCRNQIRCAYGERSVGRCFIEYSDNNNIFRNISLDLNSETDVYPLLQVGTIYNYNATITMTTGITEVKLKGSLSPMPCDGCNDSRLSKANVAVLVVGSLLWIITLVLCLIFVILQLNYINENHVKTYRVSRVLGVCGMTFLVLALPFWIAIGPVLARQKDLCDSRWQTTRVSLITCVFSLSIVAIILMIASLLFLAYSYRHVIPLIKRHPSVFRREELVMERSSTYSSPTRGEDVTNFTIKANPVFGYKFSSSPESSKNEEESLSGNTVGINNLDASAEATDNGSSLSDAEVSHRAGAAMVIEKCSDAEIIGNRFASED